MNSKKEKELGIGDVIKKVVSIGVGAAFMTEDTVKNLLGDLPLPKDIVNGLVQNAKNAKEDFSNSVREEISQHLSKVDPKKVIEEVLEDYDIEVSAKFSFKKKKVHE
ncbi:hypothetical protein [Halobacteriovorax sp. HLS]|uniref:hypothetical protein n=1 Tax=Halobacteriovorax sp. HLS TaxID=2234000 RepID=UPI000FDA7D32|nr:hypothetical protein [Halobacteriovorax sp. HLS]